MLTRPNLSHKIKVLIKTSNTPTKQLKIGTFIISYPATFYKFGQLAAW